MLISTLVLLVTPYFLLKRITVKEPAKSISIRMMMMMTTMTKHFRIIGQTRRPKLQKWRRLNDMYIAII